MLWMGLAVIAGVAIILMLVILERRSKRDLGSVSAQWVMRHRVDSR